MKVSVVIPAYKSERTIRRAIDSVLAQSVPAHEIIVVDDGSPDNQAKVIEECYGKRVILIRQANGKTANARNTGIKLATGNFVAFLDADDYWEPEKLERQLAVFAQYPEVGLVAGNFYVEEPGEMRGSEGFLRPAVDLWDRVLHMKGFAAFRVAMAVWTGMTIIRREALADERFVSGLEPAEDRDLWFRIASQHPVFMLNQPLATHVQEPGSISRSSIERDCSSMLQVVERHSRALGYRGSLILRSHTLYRWAANDPDPQSALPTLLRSFWLWPLHFGNIPNAVPLGRVKRLLVLVANAMGLKKSSSKKSWQKSNPDCNRQKTVSSSVSSS